MTNSGNLTVVQKLQKLSEKDLVNRIIIPLLGKLDFDLIDYRQGPYEKGVDILCSKTDELGELDLLAIQVKKLKFSGKATEPTHLYSVFHQISQCLEEKIKCRDGTERYANRVWLISPFELNISALELAFVKYAKASVNRVKIVDGSLLIKLLIKNAPEILVELGDKYSLYLTKIEDQLGTLQEASAFRLKDKISLHPIYIHLDTSILPPKLLATMKGFIEPLIITDYKVKEGIIKNAAGVPMVNDAIEKMQLKIKEWENFNNKVQETLNIEPVKIFERFDTVEIERKDRYKKEERIETVIPIDWELFHDTIKRITKQKIKELKELPIKTHSSLKEFFDFTSQIQDIYNHSIANSNLRVRTGEQSQINEEDRIAISIDELLESKLNYQIIGQAGAGKTTLLRVIGHKEIINKTGRIPVFVPLTNLSAKLSLNGLIQKICSEAGLVGTKKSFDDLLESGKILLLLDGIDETATRVEKVNNEISNFIKENKSTQCIFTARPWAAMAKNQNHISLQLLPFTIPQLKNFFLNWFSDDAENAEELISHFDKNPYLYEVASTPLVATIFAVVKFFGQQLPKSLLEVYKRRFELMIYSWDASKGIKRDLFDPDDKMFFMKKLAFQLHSDYKRSMDWNKLVKFTFKTLGNLRNAEQSENFLLELVKFNNVLVQQDDGNWGFGHLQYQEYLSALEAKEYSRVSISRFIQEEWWWSVVKMYSEMTRDISAIIFEIDSKYPIEIPYVILENLSYLLSLAPNTDKRAKELVEKEIEHFNTVEDSFKKYSDSDILIGKGKPKLHK